MIPDIASFVASKRLLRASWQEIARMTGVSVADLRAAYDPGYMRAHEPPPPRQEPVRREATPHQGIAAIGSVVVFERLYRAAGPLSSAALGGAQGRHAVARLRRKYGKDVVHSCSRNGYSLTAAGREIYRRHFAGSAP